MPVTTVHVEFAARLAPVGGLLAMDASKRRIGLAGTDTRRLLVTPLVTLLRRAWADDLLRLERIIRERRVAGLVLGMPFNMDGSEGPMAAAARDLAGRLDAATGLPLLLQDERLTSFAVAEAIVEGRLPRPKPDQPTDHYAAAVILTDALRALA